jgi:hypothetical protein
MNYYKKAYKEKGKRYMKKIIITLIILFIIGFTFMASIAQANLLTNPDFENDDPMGWDNWGDSNYSTDEYLSGSQSAHAWTWDNTDGKFEQWVDVTPGLQYKASGYIKSTQMSDGAAWVQFQWDGNSVPIESAKLTSAGNWTYFETALVEAPVGVATAKVAYILEAPASNLSNDVFFDDASFEEVVPEPASLLLLASGLFGLLGISRKRIK